MERSSVESTAGCDVDELRLSTVAERSNKAVPAACLSVSVVSVWPVESFRLGVCPFLRAFLFLSLGWAVSSISSRREPSAIIVVVVLLVVCKSRSWCASSWFNANVSVQSDAVSWIEGSASLLFKPVIGDDVRSEAAVKVVVRANMPVNTKVICLKLCFIVSPD